jgi:hypothetical protein
MWIHNGMILEEPADYVGFVYMIENLTNGMAYVGKKLFHFTKTKQVKGKKKRYKVESDWKDYYGSSDQLNEHVELFGKDNFRRTILRLCISKGEMTYFEAKYQFEYGVLESDRWYNAHIMARVHRKHLTFLKGVQNGTSSQKQTKKRTTKDRISKKKSTPIKGS